MASNPLIRRLRREASANPKKAGLLGLLLLVALYFWAPLLMARVRGPETKPAGDVVAEETAVEETPALESQPVKKNSFRWQPVMLAIARDQHMLPVEDAADLRDPFQAPAGQALVSRWLGGKMRSSLESAKAYTQHVYGYTKRIDAADLAPPPVPAPTPTPDGLAVSATIVGPRKRVALINGRAYSEGSLIELADTNPSISFQLVEIKSKSVVLARDGQRFELGVTRN